MKSPCTLLHITFSKLCFFCGNHLLYSFVFIYKFLVPLAIFTIWWVLTNAYISTQIMNIFTTQEIQLCPKSKIIFFKIDEFCCDKTSHKNNSHSMYSLVSRFFAQHNVCKIYPCYCVTAGLGFCFLLKSYSIVLMYKICSSILLLMNIWFVSKMRLLRIKLLWIFLYKHFFVDMLPFSCLIT